MNKFIEIDPQELTDNVFKLIGRDWMLITAGDERRCNTMTASWGGLGVQWNANVAVSFVRPSRYTYEFLEKGKYYTLSFFDSGYRRALQLCGSKSGRDTDKIKEAELTPVFDARRPISRRLGCPWSAASCIIRIWIPPISWIPPWKTIIRAGTTTAFMWGKSSRRCKKSTDGQT